MTRYQRSKDYPEIQSVTHMLQFSKCIVSSSIKSGYNLSIIHLTAQNCSEDNY